MVKPQFEVGRERLGAGGVVRDPALRAEAVARRRRGGRGSGWASRGVAGEPAARAVGQRRVLPVAAPRRARGRPGRDPTRSWRPVRRGGSPDARQRDRTSTRRQRARRVLRDATPGRAAGARRWRARSSSALTGHGIRGPRARRARRRTSGSSRRSTRVELAVATDPARRLRAGRRARRRRHDPARRRARPTPAAPRCSGVNLGHVGFLAEAEMRRPRRRRSTRDRRSALHRRGAADPRRRGVPRRRAVSAHLGAQRGQRREGRPRADARGRRRGRRPAAVPVGLRRRRLRDADRLDRLRFSAGGPVVWPEVEALLLVPISAHALFARPARGRADVACSRSRCIARQRASGVLWCDGRRTVDLPAGRPRRGTPRRAAGAAGPARTRRRSPTGWSPSSSCRSTAGVAPRERRRAGGHGVRAMLEELRITGARGHRRRDARARARG